MARGRYFCLYEESSSFSGISSSFLAPNSDFTFFPSFRLLLLPCGPFGFSGSSDSFGSFDSFDSFCSFDSFGLDESRFEGVGFCLGCLT